jgi:NAD(P)-dependent dehydrogenase (short-subunit alcohol dehydrogenase family)
VSPSSRPLTLVTGGSRGIGAATAVHLADQELDVVVGYRSGRAEAAAVVDAAPARGVRAVAVRADVSDPDDVGDAGRLERVTARVPMGRPGEPDEIAAAITWLLGPEAGYCTGAVLRVAGGL